MTIRLPSATLATGGRLANGLRAGPIREPAGLLLYQPAGGILFFPGHLSSPQCPIPFRPRYPTTMRIFCAPAALAAHFAGSAGNGRGGLLCSGVATSPASWPRWHADWRWLPVAVLVLAARDLGYIYRIRHIAERSSPTGRRLDVIMIWEFASCVLPSGQGGTGAAPFILEKEGIPLGKALPTSWSRPCSTTCTTW